MTAAGPVDVFLVQPPIRDYFITAKRTLPAGLLSIAAALRREGFSVGVFDALARDKSKPVAPPSDWSDLTTLYGPDDRSPFALFNRYRHFGYALPTIGAAIRDSGAFLIGISSLFSPYEDMALAVAEIARARRPGATIVLGGHHATTLPERLLANPAVDCVLRGDGEASLPALAHAIVHQRPLETVPGIGFRRENGRCHLAPPAFVANLNELPPPAYDLARTAYYERRGKSSVVITTSRGCPLKCSYCCTGAASAIPYRRRSIAHVMGEIRQAANRAAVGFIDFEDENISLDRGWFLSLLEALESFFGGTRPELRAMNGLHPATLEDRIIGRMRQAGFRTLNLSLGTTDPEQQKRFGRPDLRVDFDRALDAARRHDLTAVGYLIAGSPGQKPQTVIDDLLFLAGRRVLAALSIFYPAPGSRDYEWCRRHDQLPVDIARWRSTALPLGNQDDRLASVTLLRLTRILNFMKACIDREGAIPDPAPIRQTNLTPPVNRWSEGLLLLQAFLHDGQIRGIDQRGQLYVHRTDSGLTQAFFKGLKNTALRGVRQG